MIDRVHLDFVAVHFSTRCEASCTFCYASDALAEKQVPTPLPDIERMLNKIASEGVSEVLFVGGDPVVHPQFVRSVQLAKQAGLRVSVLSNTWGIRPESKFNEAVALIDTCEATVLGADATTHDSITRKSGSFEKLIANLQKVAAQGKTVGVCANAMPQNLDQIYDIVYQVKCAFNIPVHGLMIQRIVPSGAATGNFKFGLNLDDVSRLMEQIDRVSNDFRVPIYFEDPVPWCTVPERYHRYLAKCQWGYTRGSLSATGEMNRCGADDHYRLGTVWDGNIQEKWRDHPILQSFRSKKYLAEECQSCVLLDSCGGGCPLSCGTFKDHDLDQLYIQRKQQEAIGSYKQSSPSGAGFEKVGIRYAFEGDLTKIVELELRIFPENAPLFKAQKIREYFLRCPKAFRVACRGDDILGYSVIYPLTSDGVGEMRATPRNSILWLGEEHLAERIGISSEGMFLEVVATVPGAPVFARFALLRDAVRIVRQKSCPIFACAISPVGTSIVKRLGFLPVENDSIIYVKN